MNFTVAVSQGIASLVLKDRTEDDVLLRADGALYAAKLAPVERISVAPTD